MPRREYKLITMNTGLIDKGPAIQSVGCVLGVT